MGIDNGELGLMAGEERGDGILRDELVKERTGESALDGVVLADCFPAAPDRMFAVGLM